MSIGVLSQSENSNFALNLNENTRIISRKKKNKAPTKTVPPLPSIQKHGCFEP